MQQRYKRLLGCAAIVVLLDQITKIAVTMHLGLGEGVTILPGFFNLVHVLNRGAAFGVLNRGDISWQRWFFLGISLLAMIVIWFMARISKPEERWLHVGLGLIMGGALGNFIDRLHTGMVIDFLDFYIGAYHWPSFNMADSAITVGALLMIVSYYQKNEKRTQ